MTVDDTDRRILDALRADARLSVRELAARVHLSRANAYARSFAIANADGALSQPLVAAPRHAR